MVYHFYIYVINKILKTLFKKRSLVTYYHFNNIASNIYIDFDDWAFRIVRFTVFNLNITKLYNFLCTFTVMFYDNFFIFFNDPLFSLKPTFCNAFMVSLNTTTINTFNV